MGIGSGVKTREESFVVNTRDTPKYRTTYCRCVFYNLYTVPPTQSKHEGKGATRVAQGGQASLSSSNSMREYTSATTQQYLGGSFRRDFLCCYHC